MDYDNIAFIDKLNMYDIAYSVMTKSATAVVTHPTNKYQSDIS